MYLNKFELSMCSFSLTSSSCNSFPHFFILLVKVVTSDKAWSSDLRYLGPSCGLWLRVTVRLTL